MTDAERTVRFAILTALTSTAHKTGLRAGDAASELVDDIYHEVTAGPCSWALREVLKQQEWQKTSSSVQTSPR